MKDSSNEKRNIDAFIRDKVNAEQLPFDSQAWEMMEQKMDNSNTTGRSDGLTGGFNRFSGYLKFIIPIFIAISSAGIYYTVTHYNSDSKNDPTISENKNKVISKNEKSITDAKESSSVEEIQKEQAESVITNNSIDLSQLNTATENLSIRTNNKLGTANQSRTTSNNDLSIAKPTDRYQSSSGSTESRQQLSESNQKVSSYSENTKVRTAESSNPPDSEKQQNQTTVNEQYNNKSQSTETGNTSLTSTELSAEQERNADIGQKYILSLSSLDQFLVWQRETPSPALLPSKILPQKRTKKYYAGVANIFPYYLDREVDGHRFLADVHLGFNWKRITNFTFGLELYYSRIPNYRDFTTLNSDFKRNLRIISDHKRQSYDLLSTVNWKPGNGRWGIKSRQGYGMTYHKAALRSEYTHRTGDITNPLFTNENTIYTKPDQHISLGLHLNYELLPKLCVLNVGYFHQHSFQSTLTVNGTLQGYKINEEENETLYDNFEARLLDNNNLGSFFFGVEFYLY